MWGKIDGLNEKWLFLRNRKLHRTSKCKIRGKMRRAVTWVLGLQQGMYPPRPLSPTPPILCCVEIYKVKFISGVRVQYMYIS